MQELSSNRTGAYKFGGAYIMRYDGRDLVKNKPRTYKFDGRYIMAYKNDCKRDIAISYKIDGKYTCTTKFMLIKVDILHQIMEHIKLVEIK